MPNFANYYQRALVRLAVLAVISALPPKADIHQSVSQVCFGPDIKGNNQRWRVMKRLISSGSGHAARTRRRFIDLYLAPSP
jgi:hypothetical protein